MFPLISNKSNFKIKLMKRIEKLKTEKKLGVKFYPSITTKSEDKSIKENIEYLEEYLERLKELENIRLKKLEMMSKEISKNQNIF